MRRCALFLFAAFVVGTDGGLDRLALSGKSHLLLYGTLGIAVSLVVAPLVNAAFGRKGKEVENAWT